MRERNNVPEEEWGDKKAAHTLTLLDKYCRATLLSVASIRLFGGRTRLCCSVTPKRQQRQRLWSSEDQWSAERCIKAWTRGGVFWGRAAWGRLVADYTHQLHNKLLRHHFQYINIYTLYLRTCRSSGGRDMECGAFRGLKQINHISGRLRLKKNNTWGTGFHAIQDRCCRGSNDVHCKIINLTVLSLDCRSREMPKDNLSHSSINFLVLQRLSKNRHERWSHTFSHTILLV